MNGENNTDNKSILSIGTESLYSNTSIDKHIGGSNFLSSLFGSNSDDVTNVVLDAFNDKLPQIACYIIKNSILKKYDLDFTKGDASGKTLLHHLVLNSVNFPEGKLTLLSVLKSVSDATYSSSLNAQDVKLNTPLHYSVYLNLTDVTDLLIQYGADVSIKNKKGLYITLSYNNNDEIDISEMSDIFVKSSKRDMPCKQIDDSINTIGFNRDLISDSADTINFNRDDINSIVKSFRSHNTDTINFDRNEIDSDTSESKSGGSIFMSDTNVDSIDILNLILKEFQEPVNRQQQLSFVGGAKKSTGKRKLVTYSEISVNTSSVSENSVSSLNDSDLRDLSEMAHILGAKSEGVSKEVSNKATEAHTSAVEKIKNLLGVDDVTARAYKALLWDSVKKDHPELENYDKSMELLKRASDSDVLNNISKSDIKKMVKIIEDKQKEHNSSSSNVSSSSSSVINKKEKKQLKPKKNKPRSESSNYSSSDSSNVNSLSSFSMEIF